MQDIEYYDYSAHSADACLVCRRLMSFAYRVFESPTYFVAGDMSYGQDRLELIERALSSAFAQARPKARP